MTSDRTDPNARQGTEIAALEGIPVERARPGFERAVFRRIAKRRRRRAVTAAAGALALIVGLGWLTPRLMPGENSRDASSVQAKQLQARAASLELELERLRVLADRPTRLYLGGSERVDLFVDLEEVVRRRRALPLDRSRSGLGAPEIQPVSLER